MTTTHAIYELFEPLLAGIPVRVIGDAEVRDLEGFWDTIRARPITRLLIVPSQLRARSTCRDSSRCRSGR